MKTTEKGIKQPKKKISLIDNATQFGSDVLDKVSSPASRAGSVCERAGKLHAAGKSYAEIAKALTDGSSKGKIYTPEKAEALCDVFEDCKTKVNITKRDAASMIDNPDDNNFSA
jgi:hypothetical protein